MAAGATVGLAVGGAYLAGGMARDAVINAQNNKIFHAAKDGISNVSLRSMTADDPGALAIALRYDPELLAGDASHDHQAEQLAQTLGGRPGGPSSLFLRASIDTLNFNPAAQPFHATMLDQSRQLDCLSKAVYYEARGEAPAGQAAVAQVVLNRVRHPAFPKSICAVVYQGADAHSCQFSFACDGSTEQPMEPTAWTRAQKIASRALSGYVMADVGNATNFNVATITTAWDGMIKVAEVGAHVFYRFNGAHGLPSAFTAKPRQELQTAGKSATPIMAAVSLYPQPIQPAQASTASQPRPVVTPAANTAQPLKGEPVAEIKPAVPAA
jgi:spore germination cell wall hydrolase CwlJ-like protein